MRLLAIAQVHTPNGGEEENIETSHCSTVGAGRQTGRDSRSAPPLFAFWRSDHSDPT
jgi:hypothetical protein